MHEYRPTTPQSAAAARVNGGSSNQPKRGGDDDDDEDSRFPQAEGDAEGGYSYDGPSQPLVNKTRPDENEVVFDGDEELEHEAGPSSGEVVPYAHRDLKPGYVSVSHSIIEC